MKVVFLSNPLNHHSLYFCKKMYEITNGEFTYIATEPHSEERLNLGYENMNESYPFVLCSYKGEKEKEKAKKLCFDCDVLIWGAAPLEYVKKRLILNKLTFRWSERIYKMPFKPREYILRRLKYILMFDIHSNFNLLCASAFTYGDYQKTRNLTNRAYNWGYFPPMEKYDVKWLLKAKENEECEILWAGRLLEWKRPEIAIEVARYLKMKNLRFHMSIVGEGPLLSYIKDLISKNSLSECVDALGALPQKKMREKMVQSNVFLFTSTREEGWGAVLNEAMNSGCAVVASSGIGSIPSLLKDKENGFVFDENDICAACTITERLVQDPILREACGISAYETIINEWNHDIAATRFYELSKSILGGKPGTTVFDSGICAKAKVVDDDWRKRSR